MIYLDSAATTKIAPKVLEEMMPYLTEQYGNAGSLYKFGRSANAAIQKARAQVATLFNCSPENVIFTSGGSESNNMVFKGLRHRLLDAGKNHLVVSAIEHDSVLKAAEMLTKDGFYITYVKPDENGIVSAGAVKAAIQENTGLVSVMYVNNETGAVNNIEEIGKVCSEHNVLFHTDCVQAAGQRIIDVNKWCIDFASVSSHKIHGAKGTGALYIRDPHIAPLICGGAVQEYGLRGGTENVAGIVGFGKAAELVKNSFVYNNCYCSILKQRFIEKIQESLEYNGVGRECLHINSHLIDSDSERILNLRFDNIDAETLVLMLDSNDVCISAGSACRSNESKPSHVLLAMGLSEQSARSSVRISFSEYNTDKEIDTATCVMADCIKNLLGIAR